MRLFFRLLAGIALSALLALLLFSAALLVFPPPLPAWLPVLSRAEKLAALAASLFLLFLLVFLSPSLSRPSPSARKKAKRIADEPCKANAEKAAHESRAEAPSSADFIAQAVSRTVEQALASFSTKTPQASSDFDAGYSGRYVCRVSGGFEGLMPSKGETESGAVGLDSIANRGGIFIIDSEAASAGGDSDVDSNFQDLVNSVLS